MKSWMRWVLGLAFMIGGFGGGWWLAGMGFDSLAQMRQLQRVPQTGVGSALPGEVNIRAFAETLNNQLLSSPQTQTPSLYYRFKHEVKTRSSDGKVSWSTRTDSQRAVNFVLRDEFGQLTVWAGRDYRVIDWAAQQRFSVTRGDNRYTEWRIEPGDQVFVFGFAQADRTGTVAVDFRSQGFYSPIVSNFDQNHSQQGMGSGALLALWAGLFLLGFGVLGAMLLLKQHRLLVYLGWLTLALALVLTHLALKMMREDVEQGIERYQRQAVAASALAKAQFRTAKLSWQGWQFSVMFTRVPTKGLAIKSVRNCAQCVWIWRSVITNCNSSYTLCRSVLCWAFGVLPSRRLW